jgi:hypothetical protein
MKILAGHLISLLLRLIVLYGVLWTISMVLIPPHLSAPSLDTSQASHSLYMTEPKYIYLNRSPLSNAGAKVILIGASNTVMGFRQHELAPLINDATVDNLAIGGANITEIGQVVDLATQMENPSSIRGTTFVIGVWYGMFATNREWWYSPDRHGGDTDIDIERYRYGFCLRTSKGPLSLVPPAYMQTASLVIHPYLVAEKITRDVSDYIDRRLLKKPSMLSEAQRDSAVVDEAQKEEMLAYWRGRMGTSGSIPQEQFETLHHLIEHILSEGAKVVLVDLPLPHWHSSRSPYTDSYYHQLQPVVDDFQNSPQFLFLQLRGLNNDRDFCDEVHPKPHISVRWSRQLAEALNGMLDSVWVTALPPPPSPERAA